MKNYTFHIDCSFVIQFTFTEREVQSCEEDGAEGDVEPTGEALRLLRKEVDEHLRLYDTHGVYDVDVSTGFDQLLGISVDKGPEVPFAFLPPVLRKFSSLSVGETVAFKLNGMKKHIKGKVTKLDAKKQKITVKTKTGINVIPFESLLGVADDIAEEGSDERSKVGVKILGGLRRRGARR